MSNGRTAPDDPMQLDLRMIVRPQRLTANTFGLVTARLTVPDHERQLSLPAVEDFVMDSITKRSMRVGGIAAFTIFEERLYVVPDGLLPVFRVIAHGPDGVDTLSGLFFGNATEYRQANQEILGNLQYECDRNGRAAVYNGKINPHPRLIATVNGLVRNRREAAPNGPTHSHIPAEWLD